MEQGNQRKLKAKLWDVLGSVPVGAYDALILGAGGVALALGYQDFTGPMLTLLWLCMAFNAWAVLIAWGNLLLGALASPAFKEISVFQFCLDICFWYILWYVAEAPVSAIAFVTGTGFRYLTAYTQAKVLREKAATEQAPAPAPAPGNGENKLGIYEVRPLVYQPGVGGYGPALDVRVYIQEGRRMRLVPLSNYVLTDGALIALQPYLLSAQVVLEVRQGSQVLLRIRPSVINGTDSGAPAQPEEWASLSYEDELDELDELEEVDWPEELGEKK